MSFGKSQKQARNLAKKIKKEIERKAQYFEMIASLEDDESYSMTDNGKPVLNGIFATGKFWKELYRLNTENKHENKTE